MSLWQSYRTISPRTRMIIGAGVMAYAVAGMFLSDQAEKAFGFVPTEDDSRRLKEAMPKIHVVEKEK